MKKIANSVIEYTIWKCPQAYHRIYMVMCIGVMAVLICGTLQLNAQSHLLPQFSEDGQTVTIGSKQFAVSNLDEETVAQLKLRVAQRADLLNNAGVEALASENYGLAIENFEAAIAQKSDFNRAKLNLAVAYVKKKELTKAQAIYTELLAQNPDNASLWRQQATLYLLQEDVEAAAQAYGEVAKRSNADAAYMGMGRSYMAIGKYQEALDALKKAHQRNPSSAGIRYELGNAHLYLQHYREALLAYDTVLMEQPKHFEALTQKGRVLYVLQEYTNAIASFTKAIELQPKYVPAYNNRATTYSQIKNYGAALSDLEKALELDPENGTIWLNYGRVQQSIGEQEKACQSWQKAMARGEQKAKELLDEFCGK